MMIAVTCSSLIVSNSPGFINGININVLANEAILDSGDQIIAGSLTVTALNIGLWSLSVDGSGNLNVVPTIGSGAVVLQADVSVSDTVTVEGSLNANGPANIAGLLQVSNTIGADAVTVNDNLNVGGAFSAASVTATTGYNLCNGAGCFANYPTFQTIPTLPVCLNPTARISSGCQYQYSCPAGWTIVSAVGETSLPPGVASYIYTLTEQCGGGSPSPCSFCAQTIVTMTCVSAN